MIYSVPESLKNTTLKTTPVHSKMRLDEKCLTSLPSFQNLKSYVYIRLSFKKLSPLCVPI